MKVLEKNEKLEFFGFVEVCTWLTERDLWKTVQSLWKPSDWLDWTLFNTCAVLFDEKERDVQSNDDTELIWKQKAQNAGAEEGHD